MFFQRSASVKKKYFGIVLLLLLNETIAAQVIDISSRSNASVNYSRLAEIDTLMNDYIRKNWLTGAVTLIIKNNQLVQYKGYGYSDVSAKKPMMNNAIFRIMSQSKAITSAGALILYEQGKLALDEPISDFIPEFKGPKVLDTYNTKDTSYTTVPAKREITFRDLFTHTSGIGYAAIGSDTMNAIYAKANIPSGLGYFNADLLDRMKALGKLPLAHQPGEKFTYGLNSDLLGCLIEVISGMNLDQFLRKNIFEPLGMKDTYFNVPSSKANRLAGVYTEDANHNIIKWTRTTNNIDPDYPLMEKHYFSGGAGLSSTAFDYAIFLQMILNGGSYNGRQILARRTCEIMTSGQLDFTVDLDNFGLGFQITSARSAARNGRNTGSFSWGGYFGTNYWADPREHLVCLIMTQHNPNSHEDFVIKFENLVYAALK